VSKSIGVDLYSYEEIFPKCSIRIAPAPFAALRANSSIYVWFMFGLKVGS
jgi:hypothetical protein